MDTVFLLSQVHYISKFSYAPRWRMIERIDRDLDPFDGMDVTIYEDDDKDNLSEQNLDELEKAVDELD